MSARVGWAARCCARPQLRRAGPAAHALWVVVCPQLGLGLGSEKGLGVGCRTAARPQLGPLAAARSRQQQQPRGRRSAARGRRRRPPRLRIAEAACVLAFRTRGRAIHTHARIVRFVVGLAWPWGPLRRPEGLTRGWCVNGYHVCPMWAHSAWRGRCAGGLARPRELCSVWSVVSRNMTTYE